MKREVMRKSIAARVRVSKHPLALAAKWFLRGFYHFTLPAPRVVTMPILLIYLAVSTTYSFLFRIFVCEPIFKAYCRSFGRRVRTGDYIHYVTGVGDLIVGNDVLVDGKSSFSFAARFEEMPTLTIGDHSAIAHGCTIAVAKRIDIGRHCMISSGTWIFDSPGHPLEPQGRLERLPPRDEEIKPVRIGDNVWIGRGCTVFPGVTIGDGSVVSARSVVVNDVAPNTLVAGYPARKIGSVNKEAGSVAVRSATSTSSA